MELNLLLPIFTFLSVALVARSHAALPSEMYWNSELPDTPMPQVVKHLLHPEWMQEKSASVEVGKGGVHVDAGKGKPGGGTSVDVGGKGGVSVTTPGQGTPAGSGSSSGATTGKGTSVGVGKGGVNVKAGPKKKQVYVGVGTGVNPFVYNYAATENQLHDDPNVALFFLEKDLHSGTKMNLHFTTSTDTSSVFIPRKVADSVPFSSSKLPEIFHRFSVDPISEEAQLMKKTIQECEDSGIEGEDKYCATSLESMVDFSKSRLGKNVQAISTEVNNKQTSRILQEYTITNVKEMSDEKAGAVVCHKQDYAYAVFYCHKTQTTKSYSVSLVGADGTKAKAVAVCHTDTSAWNPKHLAFQVLKVKPGSVPVCHFLPEDHIVWILK